MKLSIYSLKKIIYQGEVNSFNCQTTTGEITVLNNHKPLISVLSPGVVKIQDQNNQKDYFQVSSGFLEIKSTNEARLLVEE